MREGKEGRRKREAGPGWSRSQARGGQDGSGRGSKGSLPGSAGSHEGPFQLLIGDEHHHVPGTQTEEGGHEPRREKTQVTGAPPRPAHPSGPRHPIQPSCSVPKEVGRAQGPVPHNCVAVTKNPVSLHFNTFQVGSNSARKELRA